MIVASLFFVIFVAEIPEDGRLPKQIKIAKSLDSFQAQATQHLQGNIRWVGVSHP